MKVKSTSGKSLKIGIFIFLMALVICSFVDLFRTYSQEESTSFQSEEINKQTDMEQETKSENQIQLFK